MIKSIAFIATLFAASQAFGWVLLSPRCFLLSTPEALNSPTPWNPKQVKQLGKLCVARSFKSPHAHWAHMAFLEPGTDKIRWCGKSDQWSDIRGSTRKDLWFGDVSKGFVVTFYGGREKGVVNFGSAEYAYALDGSGHVEEKQVQIDRIFKSPECQK